MKSISMVTYCNFQLNVLNIHHFDNGYRKLHHPFDIFIGPKIFLCIVNWHGCSIYSYWRRPRIIFLIKNQIDTANIAWHSFLI